MMDASIGSETAVALLATNDNGTRSVLLWKPVILMGMVVTP
jgi:hypothetical protein